LEVQQPDEPLWEARRVFKLADEQPPRLISVDDEQRTNEDIQCNDIVRLIPEFVHVLPMPLDLLFLFSELTTRGMPQLEREIDLHLQAEWLKGHVAILLSKQTPQIVVDDHPSRQWLARYFGLSGQQRQHEHQEVPLSCLLSEATTIFPRKTYERLEFLGDAVLSHFVAVVGGMSQNSSLGWACDDFEQYISSIVKNTNLALAARRTNLEQCLFTQKRVYHSAYRPLIVESKRKKKKAPPVIANSTLSACVESIIGAAYLTGKSPSYSMGGEMVLYFLEKFELLDGLDPDPFLSSTATRCCLKSGYPFDNDPGCWRERLEKVAVVLHKENNIEHELLEGCHVLLNTLCADESCAVDEYLRLPWAKLLLQFALFDDDLEDKTVFVVSEPDDFIQVALVRDTLYIVGAFSLQLMITIDLFQRYPNATPGDMHMARACVS
jgi:dsRNA-specific ribonuclease